MSTIKGIFFDAAGVFYDRAQTTGTYAAELLSELGFPTTLDANAQARKKEMRVLATEGRISPAAYWDEILTMHRVSDTAQRTDLREKILASTHNVFSYPGAHEAMAGLKARGGNASVEVDEGNAEFTLKDGTYIDLSRRLIRKKENIIHLTPAEGRLLRVLIENPGRVYSHRELVLLVQGYDTSQREAPEILRPLVSRARLLGA